MVKLSGKIIIALFILLVTIAPGFAYDLSATYEIRERIDYSLRLVFFERWSDSHYLGTEKILTFEEYLDFRTLSSIRKSFEETQKRERKKQETEFGAQGLIPEIEIPKLPIFGEGSKINISGSDKITFGGRQTTVYGAGITQSVTGQSPLPELKMEQELRVNLDGTIGERTKILIDHDSQRQFEGKNKIKLSYTGTEDDIVQSVEMGDTRLVIPGTGYTGDLPAVKGLFGVSAKGKLGGLDLYAIASTEQSQAQTEEYKGRTQLTTDTIYDHEFERRRFYWVDTMTQKEVTNLLVFLDQRIASPQNYIKGLATTNPQDPTDTTMFEPSKHRVKGKFILLKLGEDYIRHAGNLIEFRTSLDRNYVLAVQYASDTITIGGNQFIESTGDTYTVLKLLKPSSVNAQSPCWNYELRNIYFIGIKEVKLESLRIFLDEPQNDLYYDSVTTRPFISILGLDPDNDSRVTWPQFDGRNGLIIFPNRFPFIHQDLSVKDSVIYQQDPLPSGFLGKYYMAVRYSSAKESFYIGQIDVEEGSERVYVNQELWTKDVDYRINYQTGELTFIKALPPNADIRVTFEYRPWFSLSQKSLLGTRGELKFAENGKIGGAIFYRSEGTPEEKPQLGAESFRRMISEADISYSLQSQDVTSFLDRLPLLRAETPSSFSISSEAAVSLPDPNTKGLVYLDDFEGSTISSDIRFGGNGLNWAFSSVPVNKDTANFATKPLFWFTPTTRIRKDSIFGTDIGDEGREMVDYLRIIFTPDNTESWAGMVNNPSQLGLDFRELENLEVVLRTRNRNNGRIHISVGTDIDEDAPRRTRDGLIVGYNEDEDTEDRNRNGMLDKVEGEDSGLDTVLGKDTDFVAGDDGNDDYDAVNNPTGTENNGILNSEDLDRNGWARINNYFEYTVDLADPEFFQNLQGDWRFLRIPLINSGVDTVIGSPRWEDIRLVRVWFDGFSQADTIDVYSFAFVGSKWRDVEIKKDSLFYPHADTVDTTEKAVLSQISIKTDPNYVPPFEPKQDYLGRLEIEVSLKLAYDRIKPGHLVQFYRFTYEREDYRDYKTLRMYVHNDVNDPVYFLRIGNDTTNYYEFRIRISEGKLIPGRDNLWYEFEIPLDTFPKIKSLRGNQTEYYQIGPFAVKGNPSLAEVRYQAMGIVNQSNAVISGAVWFDDIRLHEPRKDPGYGLQSRIGLNLSDFSNFAFGISYNDPNFRRLSEGRGVKTGGFSTNTSYEARINLDRLMPRSWNFMLPLSFRVDRNRSLPKFSAYYPDLRLDRSEASEEASTREANVWSIDNARKGRSNNRLLNYTIEAFSYSWRRRTGYSDEPLRVDSSYSTSSNLNYGISPDLNISLFGEEFYLFPQSIQTGITVAKTRAPYRTRTHPDSTNWISRTDSSHNASFDFDVSYTPAGELSFDYNFSQDRDFIDSNPSRIAGINIGTETGQEQAFGTGYGIEIGEIISPRVDFNSEYHEERYREEGEYSNLRNLGNGAEIDFTVDIELPEILSGAARLRDERKDSNAFVGSPQWFLLIAEKLSEILEPIDFGYSKSRNSDVLNIRTRPDWKYRFGLVDHFAYDSLLQQPSINLDYFDNFGISSGANLKDLNLRLRFDHSINKNYYGNSGTRGWSTTWPDLSITISRIEKFLKNWATSSNISTGYSRRWDISGNLDPKTDTLELAGRIGNTATNFSPLFSWQTTWKKRITTNLSFNYSQSKDTNFMTETSARNRQRSGTFSLSYTFNAPQGIKFPGLKRLRFSSDLNLTWSFRFSDNYSGLLDPNNPEYPKPVVQRKDYDISTSVSASYRVSRSVESGLSTGYSQYKNVQRGTATRSIDLNFWVLFRF
ncbi:MAG: hypothetical protein OEZ20_02400 [candidate division WOR-3 bacterium]|nr:hypothetical protein [candidate division WOR-3 bacterium]